MMRLTSAIAVLLIASCGGSSSKTTLSPAYQADVGYLREWSDLDRYDGMYVSIEGEFDHIKGMHGVVKMENGLRINIPHMDLFERGKPWLEYVGKRVRAGGLLHSYTKPIEGYHGPTLEIREFIVVGAGENP